MDWRQWKEETLQLWTKAVDRASAPGLPAIQISLAPGQTEEPRLSLQPHSLSAKSGGGKRFYPGPSRRLGPWLWDYAGDTREFHSFLL